MSGSHDHTGGGPAGDLRSPVHRLDPRAKILGLVAVTVVAVSTPISAWVVWVGCAAVLATRPDLIDGAGFGPLDAPEAIAPAGVTS